MAEQAKDKAVIDKERAATEAQAVAKAAQDEVDQQAKINAEVEKRVAAERKQMLEDQRQAEQREKERQQAVADAPMKALAAREIEMQRALEQTETVPSNQDQPVIPRPEEGLWANTEVALDNQRRIAQMREIERAQLQAKAVNDQTQRPVVITDAVLRASQSASAAEEAALLRLDVAPPGGARYLIGGKLVDPDGRAVQ